MDRIGKRFERAIAASRFRAVSTALAESTLVEGVRSFGGQVVAITRGSWLYRWLTTEPEPEVIVIDLRQTRTVGPVLALLESILGRLAPYWERSAFKHGYYDLVSVGGRAVDCAAESRLGQLLTAILTPPEPPDSTSDSSASTSVTDSDFRSVSGDEPNQP